MKFRFDNILYYSDDEFQTHLMNRAKVQLGEKIAESLSPNRCYKVMYNENVSTDDKNNKHYIINLDIDEIPEYAVRVVSSKERYLKPNEKIIPRIKNAWNYIINGNNIITTEEN